MLSMIETVVHCAFPAGRPDPPACNADAMLVRLARMKLPAAFLTAP